MADRDGVDVILEQWRRERPELDHSPIGVIGRISRLARELERRLEPVYAVHGLEPGWHDVLAPLRRTGPAPDPADRRGILIALTDAGRELIDSVTEAHLDNERRLLSSLTKAEQRELAGLLRKLRRSRPRRRRSTSARVEERVRYATTIELAP